MILSVVLAVSLVSGASAKEAAGGSKGGERGIIAVEARNWTATIKAVDYAKQTAVLGDGEGRTVEINEQVARNLDQVMVGDKVNMKYVEQLAIFVRNSHAPAIVGVSGMLALTPKGTRPEYVITEATRLRAEVEGIDYKETTVTLKSPSGDIQTYKINGEVRRLKEIRKGDQVVIDITRALTLEVVKPYSHEALKF